MRQDPTVEESFMGTLYGVPETFRIDEEVIGREAQELPDNPYNARITPARISPATIITLPLAGTRWRPRRASKAS